MHPNTGEWKGFFLPLEPGGFCSEFWLFPYFHSMTLPNSRPAASVQDRFKSLLTQPDGQQAVAWTLALEPHCLCSNLHSTTPCLCNLDQVASPTRDS